MTQEQAQTSDNRLSVVLITLFKGVVYRDEQTAVWQDLLKLQSAVRDYVAVLGLELKLFEEEGYAWLAHRTSDPDDGEPALPRLVTRRSLSFAVSVLLALLRKRLLEFDALGHDSRLVVSFEEIQQDMQSFLPAGSNEAKLMDQLQTHINKVVELGFLKKMKPPFEGAPPTYEVRRIIAGFIDSQWLDQLQTRLKEYQDYAQGVNE
ncbi:DUF4194 domain-containing protein [Hydrogenovibrio halophilus]|uniref:DUF4194 domain-containing protein n=1 Tax=Hydrogenovibrio halophilus TaxID=373391 RepID=UPI00036FE798|nr:DUF4194 domain-containing protein [Hydrogenovibrio halophilus]